MGNECAAAIVSADWEESPLGQPASWPSSLRTLLSAVLDSPAPKLLIWTRRQLTFFNDAYLALAGREAIGRIGMPLSDVDPEAWPVVAPVVEEAFAGQGKLLRRVMHSDRALDDSEAQFVDMCFTPVRHDKRAVEGVLVDLRDVTETVRLQTMLEIENRRLNELFASAPAIIAQISLPDCRFQFVNKACVELFGGRKLVGELVTDAIPELGEHNLKTALEQMQRTGKPWVAHDVPLALVNRRTKEIEAQYLDLVYQPIISPAGAITGILCSGSQVTDRKRATELAQQLEHRLLHASTTNAMGTMAMVLAHELNQPLAAAMTYIAAARRFIEAEDSSARAFMRQSFEHAESQIRRAGDIIRRTRELVAAGRSSLREVALQECFDGARSILDAAGDIEDFELRATIAPGAEFVLADRVQVEQVLVNLIRNAAQASRRCSRLEAVLTAEREGDLVTVALRDWGPGLRNADFGSFFKVFRSGSGGQGLGLSLCATIIEAHGGRIWARNNEDDGATFFFTLPAPAAAPEPTPPLTDN